MKARAALIALLAPLALSACKKPADNKPVIHIDFDNPSSDFARDPALASDAAASEAAPEASEAPKAASACEAVTFEDAKFTHCVADPAKDRIELVDAAPGGAPYRSFKAFAGARPADAPPVVFAINGGMFDGAGKPIGYYVENGKRLKELNRADGPGNFHMKPNGVFYGANGKWHVRTSDDFYHTVGDRPDFGTQSGPMLVINGKLHPQITDDGPSRIQRDGVGIDRAGRAHFVISEGAVSFGKIARYFRDVLKTPDALYLDGGVSSLWDPASGRTDSAAPLGPMIVVTSKQAAP